MPAHTHDSLMACHARVMRALLLEAGYRQLHDDWVERERFVVAVAANEYATAHGLATITVDDVERVEHLAIGHVDYATKLALYTSELVHGAREVRP